MLHLVQVDLALPAAEVLLLLADLLAEIPYIRIHLSVPCSFFQDPLTDQLMQQTEGLQDKVAQDKHISPAGEKIVHGQEQEVAEEESQDLGVAPRMHTVRIMDFIL
jgi:hypothetical protein